VSGRNVPELPYAAELTAAGATVALTRTPHGDRPAGRLSAADLMPLLVPGATAYVCGSAGFAEFASLLLVRLGVPVQDVRVERFGPSG
jgi:ferredoxin-NADP reductase